MKFEGDSVHGENLSHKAGKAENCDGNFICTVKRTVISWLFCFIHGPDHGCLKFRD